MGHHWSYSHSKTCMKSLSFEMYLRMMKKSEIQRTILTCDPGTVNTKMLLAGWGACGIQVYEARRRISNGQFTLPQNNDISANPGYTEGKEFAGDEVTWETCKRDGGVVRV